MLWLTPKEDRLWAGPRADRLRFFDRLVLSGAPDHGRIANAFEKAMRGRQRLLEQESEGGRVDPAWLDALESEMAEHAVALAAARLDALARLQAEIDARPQSRFPKADLAFDGAVEAELAQGVSADDAESWYVETLKTHRRRDGAAGRALSGPHRTEVVARHREKDQAAADCSTGEQKALVLGLALAQAAALKRARGAPPVLIFDEASAHLDSARRAGLAEAIAAIGAQAWLTGVERALFDPFGDAAQYVAVEDGAAEIVG